MPLTLLIHHFRRKIHFKNVVRNMEARFKTMFNIVEILKINVTYRSSKTNYASGYTLCSRCGFIDRIRRESVVIWIEDFREKVVILVEENFNMDFLYIIYIWKKVLPQEWVNFIFRDPSSPQQVQYFHYPLHPHGKFVNISEGTRPINSMNVWSWIWHSRESMNMKRIFHECMNMNLQIA